MSFRKSRIGAVMATVVTAAAFASSAQAATTGPTAIGQDSKGVSYVGFASGGVIQKLDASGTPLTSITPDQTGPVDGIGVDPSDNVWVDYGSSVSELTATGAVLTHFATAGGSCSNDPSRYGGIAVTATTVYVAARCTDVVLAYSRTGTLQAKLTLPAGGFPRGIAYGAAQNSQPAALYVSLPDQNKVLTFNAGTLTSSSTATHTLSLVAPSGGVTPVPSGVGSDIYGQLLVLDAANNDITFYDTNNSYGLYRTLGHPPAAGTAAGSFSNPTAVALHSQDGSSLANNLFVADTGNSRVQRLDSGGYSFWATPATAGTASQGVPTNTALPMISGTPAVGQTLTCSNGSWTGSPTSYHHGFNRDGSYISGPDSPTYVVQSADAGHQISCFVTAVNSAGTSGYATSPAVSIAASTAAPTNTAAPTITGTATTGSTLTCNPGTWTGSPTFAYKFLRDSTQVGTAQTYKLVAADVGHAITCVVTGTNSGGSTSATSAAVVPTSPATCTGNVGISINGAALYTTATAVTLTIHPPAGATAVQLSNDGGFSSPSSQALAGSCGYSWTLSSTGSERLPKTVYVRFPGSADPNETFTDDIVLDQSPPAAKSATLKGRTLRVKAMDSNSGVGTVEYAATRSTAGARKVAFHAKLHVKSARTAKWVRVFDRAGNPSRWLRVAHR